MRRPIIRFVSIFFGCLWAFSAFAAVSGLQNRLAPIERAIASVAASLAQLAGSKANVVSGNIIVTESASLEVNHECTGLFVFVVLFSFILAYPAPWQQKVAGMILGVALLSAVNVARIAMLVRLVEFYPSLFDYFHEYVWQGVFLMLVTLYAMAWVERARPT
ncbi:MAG: archaeosortase/exosortase family protein [Candidatus Binatia bacterium]|nr:archaeosortase/exosortase family protein [Candidatus Binatia bacterium]